MKAGIFSVDEIYEFYAYRIFHLLLVVELDRERYGLVPLFHFVGILGAQVEVSLFRLEYEAEGSGHLVGSVVHLHEPEVVEGDVSEGLRVGGGLVVEKLVLPKNEPPPLPALHLLAHLLEVPSFADRFLPKKKG